VFIFLGLKLRLANDRLVVSGIREGSVAQILNAFDVSV
jgi:hypothetical protein